MAPFLFFSKKGKSFTGIDKRHKGGRDKRHNVFCQKSTSWSRTDVQWVADPFGDRAREVVDKIAKDCGRQSSFFRSS